MQKGKKGMGILLFMCYPGSQELTGSVKSAWDVGLTFDRNGLTYRRLSPLRLTVEREQRS